MPRFEHALLTFESIEQTTDSDGKRVYRLPTGEKYRSVTTVLGEAMDKSGLIEWGKRVGEQEANRISTHAANRGTKVHKIVENYLLNEPRLPKGVTDESIEMFQQLKPILDSNINKILAIEAPLYSRRLKKAGRTDSIVEWNGVPSILDIKTSRNPKKEEWILSYFLQTTCYSLMLEEIKEIKCPQVCIVIATDEGSPQIFIRPRDSYVPQVEQIFIANQLLYL